jgi:phage terminase small subunit
MADGKLTPKQEAFCQAYIETGNASEAYRRAYDVSPDTKPETINRKAIEVLQNGKVTARIEAARQQLAEKHEVTADRIVRELALLGFANMLDYIRTTSEGDAYVDLSALTREQAAAISEVTVETYAEGKGDDAKDVKRVKFKLNDKRAALVDLGKHLGIFKEIKDVNVTGNLKHSHEAESVSATHQWAAGLLGSTEKGAAKKPLPN